MVALALSAALVLGSLGGAAASAGPAYAELLGVYSEALALAAARGVLPQDLAARALALGDPDSGMTPEKQAAILAELDAALAEAPAPSAADQAALQALTLRFGALALPAAAEVASPGIAEASDPCEDDCNWAYWECALDCWVDWAACVARAKWLWTILSCYAHYLVCLSYCGGELKACLDECSKHGTVVADPSRLGLPPIRVTIAQLEDPTPGIRLQGSAPPAGAEG